MLALYWGKQPSFSWLMFVHQIERCVSPGKWMRCIVGLLRVEYLDINNSKIVKQRFLKSMQRRCCIILLIHTSAEAIAEWPEVFFDVFFAHLRETPPNACVRRGHSNSKAVAKSLWMNNGALGTVTGKKPSHFFHPSVFFFDPPLHVFHPSVFFFDKKKKSSADQEHGKVRALKILRIRTVSAGQFIYPRTERTEYGNLYFIFVVSIVSICSN
jgi:hypothetical protein